MRRSLPLLVVLSVLLAACASDEGDGSTTTSAPAESTTTSVETTTTTSPPVTTTTEPEASGSGGGADCLVGTWMLDSGTFVDQMLEIFAQEEVPADEISALDGTYVVTIDSDGTWSGVRDEWGFTVVSSDGVFTLSINGTDSGVWSATDDTVTITVDDSDTTVSATIEVDGQTFPIPESPVEVPDAIASDSEYSCDGEMLTVINEGITTTLTRA